MDSMILESAGGARRESDPTTPTARPGRRRQALFPRLAAQPERAVATATLAAIFGVVVLVFALRQVPRDLAFFNFAFADPGSWLADQFVAAHGGRPGVDFGYLYGLLPLAIGRAWFGLWGLTPWAYEAAMIVCGLLMAAAMARFAHALRLSVAAILFMIFALPVAIRSSNFSLAHAIEALLMVYAIAAHANGKRSTALALATAACFARPAMGYVYVAILVVAIAADMRRADPTANWQWWVRASLRELAPAAIVATALVGVLTAVYGPRAMAATILPIAGSRYYHEVHLGFFNSWGRSFWYIPGVSPFAYAATVAPFWLAASAWLIVAGIIALRNLWWGDGRGANARCDEDARRDEILASCAAMSAMFIFVMFGGPTSWSIYSYVPVMGVAAASVPGLLRARIGALLMLTAIVGQIGLLMTDRGLLTSTAPSSATAGLWSSALERDEWTRVRELTRGAQAPIVSLEGGAALLQPGFAPPINPYLIPGITTRAQLDRSIDQMRRARMVVVPISPVVGGYAPRGWPAVAHALAEMELVWRGRLFAVYRQR